MFKHRTHRWAKISSKLNLNQIPLSAEQGHSLVYTTTTPQCRKGPWLAQMSHPLRNKKHPLRRPEGTQGCVFGPLFFVFSDSCIWARWSSIVCVAPSRRMLQLDCATKTPFKCCRCCPRLQKMLSPSLIPLSQAQGVSAVAACEQWSVLIWTVS